MGKRTKLLWISFGVGFMVALGLIGGTSSVRLLFKVLPLIAVGTGLAMLFPLAAFGPKTEEQRKSRVTTALLGCAQVVMGASLIITDDWRLGLSSLALLMTLSAVMRRPRSLFEPADPVAP